MPLVALGHGFAITGVVSFLSVSFNGAVIY
jgi:hypothetical protein